MELSRYTDPIEADDPHANFKDEVAEHTRIDPLPTLEVLSEVTGIPVGALVRYVLVKWSSEGHEMLMHTGPRLARRMKAIVDEAEAAGDDAARLAAYRSLADIVSWLVIPLDDAGGGDGAG